MRQKSVMMVIDDMYTKIQMSSVYLHKIFYNHHYYTYKII